MSIVNDVLWSEALPSTHRTRTAEGRNVLRPVLLAHDAAAVACAWLLAHLLVPSGTALLLGVATATAVGMALLGWNGLWLARVCSTRVGEASRLARVAAGTALASVLVAGHGGSQAARAVVGGGLTLAFLTGARGFYDAWLRAERARGRFTRAVVVVGRGEEADRVLDLLGNHPELGYRVRGLLGDSATAERHGVSWLGDPRLGAGPVAVSGASGVVVAGSGMEPDGLNRLVRQLHDRGLHVQMSSGLWRVDHRRLRLAPLAHEPFFYLKPAPVELSRHHLAVKRTLDLVLASITLLVAGPVLLVAALAVKLGDGGPVLFRQTRVGRNGRPFTLLKFRTMVADAEARRAELEDANQRDGVLFKVDHDPRVTRVGRVLRATSLDELPQLLNVLAGTMSLVGPRPALPEEVAHFDADLLGRHRLPPGVTGLWQLEARDNASLYAYRHLDLFYVENWSVGLDLVVLAATLPAVVARSLRALLGRGLMAAEAGGTAGRP
jgi:exopolysaccharide biosynthesis polyprenyl glycosylphosphotransferase